MGVGTLIVVFCTCFVRSRGVKDGEKGVKLKEVNIIDAASVVSRRSLTRWQARLTAVRTVALTYVDLSLKILLIFLLIFF